MSKSILQDKEYLRYIREIQRYPLLKPEEEQALAYQAREGDRVAVERLVTANLRFVVKVALQYRGYGFRLLDLIQEGNLGLMQGVEKFDPDRGFRLVTYAVHWIRAYIRSFILKQWSLVRVGTTHAERRLFYRLPKARRELGAAAEGAPQEVLAALAKHLDATEDEVKSAEQRIYGRDLSLQTPLQSTDGDRTMEDVIPDEHGLDQAETVIRRNEQAALRGAIEQAIEALDDRERYIIRRRYLGDEKATLQEIGDELGLSRERVRQLETVAKARLEDTLRRDASDLVEDTFGEAIHADA